MSRPRISSCGTDKLKLDHYPEIVGITIFIFGETFADFDGATRDCFGAFSVGTGEVVRGRLDDCVMIATPLPCSDAGSWASFERLSERGGATSSSSSSSSSSPESSPSSSSSASESHSSGLSPPLPSSSSVGVCAPLGIEYNSVVAYQTTKQNKDQSTNSQQSRMNIARLQLDISGHTVSGV